MDVIAWVASVEAIASATPAAASDLRSLRNLTFGLWSLFTHAPLEVRNHYQALSQVDSDLAHSFAALIERGNGFSIRTQSVADAVADAAMLLRALELSLVGLGQFAAAPRRAIELEVSYDGARGYLIPFQPRYRQDLQEWPPYFARRGLRQIRFLPETLSSGHRVKFELAELWAPEASLRGAAALFQRVIALDEGGDPIDFSLGGPFLFHGLADDPSADLASRLAECYDESSGCDLVAFPELSMPPDRTAELERLLRTKPWNEELPSRAPMLVLGGSWHVQDAEGNYRNRTKLFDGDGNLLGHHDKIAPFSHPAEKGGETLREDVVAGDEILVVATPGLTVAIGICLDYCQAGDLPNAYDELDVDLVLVCSMGSDTTMVSHRDEANRIWNNRKTGTFITQQSDHEPFGYVAARPYPKGSDFSSYVNAPLSKVDLPQGP